MLAQETIRQVPTFRKQKLTYKTFDSILRKLKLPEVAYKMTDIEMVSMWQDAFKKGAIKDMEAFQQIYSEDIVKFGTFLQEMGEKYNKGMMQPQN